MTSDCWTLTPTRAMSFIWSRDIPSKRSRVFTSTRYWIWETNALTDLVVCLIAYFRRTSRGCSLSQQISASNCLATDTLSPFLTIMSPREISMSSSSSRVTDWGAAACISSPSRVKSCLIRDERPDGNTRIGSPTVRAPRFDTPHITAEIVMFVRTRATDPLYGKTKISEIQIMIDIDVLKQLHECRPVIPRQIFAAIHNHVALERRDRNMDDIAKMEAGGKPIQFFADIAEYIARIAHQVHLVHCYYQMRNAHQARDIGVAARLRDHSVACVDENHGQIGSGRSGQHVARVLLVARCVGDDKLAFGRGKIAISNVDRNALLPLRHKPIGEQG